MQYFLFRLLEIKESKLIFPALLVINTKSMRKYNKGISNHFCQLRKPLFRCTLALATIMVIIRGIEINRVVKPDVKRATPAHSVEAIKYVWSVSQSGTEYIS